MGLITNAQVTALRTYGNRGLTQVATVERQSQIETDFGSEEQWTAVGTFDCWVREMGLANSITEVGMREAIVMIFRVHFEWGTDVIGGDRFTVDGKLFQVIDDNAENTIQIFRTVTAKRVL